MATAKLSEMVTRLGRRPGPPDPAAPDPDLLARFLADRDEQAFALLVRRHGPMVFGVCRRVTGDHHLAEDAFQAVFVVLAAKAGAVRPRAALPAWLYGVAYRTALRARTMADRRRKLERLAGRRRPAGQSDEHPADRADVVAALDAEIARLPEHLRVPVVLCELEGRPRPEVAGRLGIPEGTLSSRLAAARKALAARLRSRGVALSAAGLTAAFTRVAGAASVPADLTARAVAAAVTPGAVPAPVAALSHGVLRVMFAQKLKAVPIVLTLFAAVALAAGLLPAADRKPDSAPEPGTVRGDAPNVIPPTAPKPRPRPGPGRLLVVSLDRFAFRSPSSDPDGAPPAHPYKALFFAGCLSPGAKWFAYTARPLPGAPDEEVRKGHRLFVRDLTAKDRLTAIDVSARHLCWSPDGSKLLAVEHSAGERNNPRPGHWLIDPKTGEKEGLALPPGHVHDWSPDGKGFLMSVIDARRSEAHLSVVSRDGEEETVLYRMSRPCWPEVCRFSPDGRAVLFGVPADENSEEWLKSLPRLYTLDVATKTRRKVDEVPLNASVTHVCWSPDGKRIAYQWRPVPLPLAEKRFRDLTDEERSVETEEFIVVADADGRNATVVTSDKGPAVNSIIFTGLDWQ